MRNRFLMVILAFCAFVLVACPESCDDSTSPTGFSNLDSNANGPDGLDAPRAADVSRWSPYIGLHAFAPQNGRQQKYLKPLIDSGAMRGVRFDVDVALASGGPQFKQWFLANGLTDFLAIFPNEHLRSPDAWEQLRTQMGANPDVQYWEIGNEVELNWPSLGRIAMTPEEYTPIFLDLHAKASREFPNQIIMPSAIHGASLAVPFLERMLDLGLEARARDPDIPLKILAVHYYGHLGPFLRATKAQVERIPSVEIWITETGKENMGRHISWVQNEYARAMSQLRATRVYWYQFSTCDEYALVHGLATVCDGDGPRFSPLYDALTGGAR